MNCYTKKMKVVVVALIWTRILWMLGQVLLSFTSLEPPVPHLQCSPLTSENEHLWLRNATSLTLVTAYFDLGNFAKAGSDDYAKWGTAWTNVNNYVVFYTDSVKFASRFEKIRRKNKLLSKTVVKLSNRENFYTFRVLEPKIRKLSPLPALPKLSRNPINSLYMAMTHAKFEILRESIEKNYFNTSHFAWIDFGYFRDSWFYSTRLFELTVPEYFHSDAVAFTNVSKLNPHQSPLKVESPPWVAGGYFVCAAEVCKHFCEYYKKFVMKLTAEKGVGNEQVVLAAMFVDGVRSHHALKVQTFSPGRTGYAMEGRTRRWFLFLGYYSAKELWPDLNWTSDGKPEICLYSGTASCSKQHSTFCSRDLNFALSQTIR